MILASVGSCPKTQSASKLAIPTCSATFIIRPRTARTRVVGKDPPRRRYPALGPPEEASARYFREHPGSQRGDPGWLLAVAQAAGFDWEHPLLRQFQGTAAMAEVQVAAAAQGNPQRPATTNFVPEPASNWLHSIPLIGPVIQARAHETRINERIVEVWERERPDVLQNVMAVPGNPKKNQNAILNQAVDPTNLGNVQQASELARPLAEVAIQFNAAAGVLVGTSRFTFNSTTRRWMTAGREANAAELAVIERSPTAINITPTGIAHVAARHVPGGAQSAGRSLFTAGEDVLTLIRQAEHELHRYGRLRATSNALLMRAEILARIARTGGLTSTYTVITNPAGDLVTAFPGIDPIGVPNMSLIRAVAEDETGTEVGNSIMFSASLLPGPHERFNLLGFIDPYGDTIFNQLQIPAVIQELELLEGLVEGTEAKLEVAALETLAKSCAGRPHVYLKLLGD